MVERAQPADVRQVQQLLQIRLLFARCRADQHHGHAGARQRLCQPQLVFIGRDAAHHQHEWPGDTRLAQEQIAIGREEMRVDAIWQDADGCRRQVKTVHDGIALGLAQGNHDVGQLQGAARLRVAGLHHPLRQPPRQPVGQPRAPGAGAAPAGRQQRRQHHRHAQFARRFDDAVIAIAGRKHVQHVEIGQPLVVGVDQLHLQRPLRMVLQAVQRSQGFAHLDLQAAVALEQHRIRQDTHTHGRPFVSRHRLWRRESVR
ncbi:hypothetical protein D3C81_275350 [compost metagenome]